MQDHQWKSDGTELNGTATWSVTTMNEGADDVAAVAKIQVSNPGGSPMNLLYSATPPPPESKKYFFKVHIAEMSRNSSGHVSVGVARRDEFKKGYGLKGMFYNGNLTNASAALKTAFGPYLKQGDTVVIEYDEGDDESSNFIRFNVYLNGNFLGTGFQIPKPSSDEECSFLPCLSIDGTVTVHTQILSEYPADTISPNGDAPFSGKWNVTLISSENETTAAPIWPVPDANHPLILSIETGYDQQQQDSSSGNEDDIWWNFSIKADNSLSVQKYVEKIQEEENDDGGNAGQWLKYKLRNAHGDMVASTRKMPFPPWDGIERYLASAMPNQWSRMQVLPENNSSELHFLSENGTTIVKCTKVQPTTTPACTSYKN